ncbi:perilipin-1 isoform X3 [Elephas maximus indicus]|uniref:perilipin-1 isoform X3 n=1 Tax=Elephas maximus indicus TaxID=99487 RepID=UPI002116BFF6|nr:perilipin-1 isoform X3 [Elephas maximus indicus]
MAVNKSPTMLDEDLPEKENVIQRVLQLPVVSGTCECFQKTYASTKESHPLVASVCNAYEKGVQGASNLAAWSMEPVVRRLSTQFIAANDLACRGLDHLEEKIPALQYPPEKIASELKDTISTRLRSARNSISVPITSTSDKVLGAALAGCELALGVAKDTAEFAANTRAGRLASGGADLALGGIEKMVEFLLPPAKEESASDPGCQRTQKKLPKGKPSLLSRVGALANTLSHHTFQTTAWALKQGTDMALWIPGVAPLSNLAQWGASAAMQAVSRRQSGVPWLHNIAITQEEDHNDQNDTEGEETEEEEEEEEEKETEEKLSELPRLSLMEPESEFRDIDNPPAEAERRGSGARATGPECLPRPALYRSSLRNARGSGPSQDDKLVTPAAPSPGFPAVPREKPTRRVSDSFFRPSVMEPILGRAQYGQLRKKS